MAAIKYYKSPLTIYVVWHPKNDDGLKIAEDIYNSFCRDVNSPLSRGLNIPVVFRYISLQSEVVPIDIDTSTSDKNAVILLADDEMFLDVNWQSYVSGLLDKENATIRIFPVALSKYAFYIDEIRLSNKQFINLTKHTTFVEKINELRSRLLHDLSRFLFNLSKVADADAQKEQPPVRLFVSHAKVDGERVAIEFRDYVQSQTKLKTFFDVNDIADAEDFAESIKNNLKNTAIVVFLSDKYSTREWCRIEVIVAKRNKSPLVVVNNLTKGEKRSFPYLGNVPTIRYQENSFNDIIDLALYQVLNNLYVEEKLKKEIALHNLNALYIMYPIENAPELFNYIDIKKLEEKTEGKKILVLYPDPPLGNEELDILNDINDNIKFVTPSLLHNFS